MRLVLAGLLAVAAPLTAPAHAAGGVDLVCLLTYPSYGACTVDGVVDGRTITNGTATISFSTSGGCPSQRMVGTVYGALTVSFILTRIGPVGAVASSGELNATGSVVFSAPCPTQGETVVMTLGGA